eukprot:5139955-Amphidinium_carterae.1
MECLIGFRGVIPACMRDAHMPRSVFLEPNNSPVDSARMAWQSTSRCKVRNHVFGADCGNSSQAYLDVERHCLKGCVCRASLRIHVWISVVNGSTPARVSDVA